ncbi:hypothetical protein FN846DRAFT_913977 [Sphaerosporella brunnea]|uniref:Uncharacterized protein n=1 Tax=Sphaerosporella brunnea TaxID=1250544 RepID=A0A5J5EEU2_9PEZI|nr:hypothetical protein FN846DRAFT_913977 [Sphaerosporella brunnea]
MLILQQKLVLRSPHAFLLPIAEMAITESRTITRPFTTPMDIKMIVKDVDGAEPFSELPTSSPTCRILHHLRQERPTLPIIITSTGKQRRSTAELREALDLHPCPCCRLNGNVIYSPSESGLEIPWS